VTALWVALAGSAGALARFGLDGGLRRRWPTTFPWATLVVNVTGSLLLGLVTGLVLFRGEPDPLRIIVGTGFCGGYTTFSTASFETVRLLQTGRRRQAATNAVSSLLLTVLAGGAGLALARLG
jgi:fluoride exporter